MSGFTPADSKREEFRKYLETAGVMDALTKVLVGLYEEPEKPNDALDYLKENLGAHNPDKAALESLQTEVEELKQKVSVLETENSNLKKKLEKYEPTEPATDG